MRLPADLFKPDGDSESARSSSGLEIQRGEIVFSFELGALYFNFDGSSILTFAKFHLHSPYTA